VFWCANNSRIINESEQSDPSQRTDWGKLSGQERIAAKVRARRRAASPTLRSQLAAAIKDLVPPGKSVPLKDLLLLVRKHVAANDPLIPMLDMLLASKVITEGNTVVTTGKLSIGGNTTSGVYEHNRNAITLDIFSLEQEANSPDAALDTRDIGV